MTASAGGARVLLATRNASKARELRDALGDLGYHVVDLDAAGVPRTAAEDAIEVHATFEENALAKARYYASAGGGMPTVADDSGLAVDALGGAPGVHSRRWSGVEGPEAVVTEANNAKLLQALADAGTRAARFVCAIAFVDGADELVVRGEARGRIASGPRGANGFGYDPLFEADALGGRTFAEATAEEKARVGHRGRAIAEFARVLAGRDAVRRAGGR